MKNIKDNMHVVLKKGTKMKVLRISKHTKITFDKRKFCITAAIDQPFGTTWEVKGNGIVAVENTDLEALENAKSAEDNRDIKENSDSQKLQHDEINSLKEQGLSAEGIIERLVDNHASFENKTAFSQEKYVKKKKDKYLSRFTICEPSIRLICELHWRKTPSPKIIHLRPDTLAQMLACTNVHSGSKVMLVEHCQGLLVAAVLERLSGRGNIVHLHTEDVPCTIAEEYFDFPPAFTDIMMRMQLSYFDKVMIGGDKDMTEPMEVTANGAENVDDVKEGPSSPLGEPISSLSEPTVGVKSIKEESAVDQQSVDKSNLGFESSEKERGPVMDTKKVVSKDSIGTAIDSSEEVSKGGIGTAIDTEEDASKGAKAEPPSDTECTTDAMEVSSTCTMGESSTATKNEAEMGTEGSLAANSKEDSEEHPAGTKEEGATENKEKPSRKRKHPINREREQRRLVREEINQQIAQLLNKRDMDALLIASRFHPAPILSRLMEYLAPSRPFVVYCSAIEPLVECYSQLKENGGVLDMQLTETWLREYQVLENRTHPLVNMSGTGGYILTGTKVTSE